jgi:hypothetical protein
MGRPFNRGLWLAESEVRRFIRAQAAECEKIGYPKQAAFAKHIALGVVRSAPIEDDPVMDCVGRWYWNDGLVAPGDRRILSLRFSGLTQPQCASELRITVRFMRGRVDRLLTGLAAILCDRGY